MERATKARLWTKDFTLLWQGQFVSEFGNAIFAVALGFWAYATTGNEAVMGMVMACFSIPSIVLGPLSGTLADRLNRKWLIIGSDAIRGLIFLAMGALILFDLFPFWCIYPLALLAGACGAFHSPAMSSVLPDIVDRSLLTQANSARSLASALDDVIGTPVGGVLYTVLGAPVVFLFNGVSYLYAAAAQLFLHVPRRQRTATSQRHILADMGEGFRYIWSNNGLRMLIAIGAFLNFFFTIATTLFIPWFDQTPWLGAGRYGFTMGALTAGAILGMLLLSAIKVPAKRRAMLFSGALVVMGIMITVAVFLKIYWLIVVLVFLSGLCNAVVNVLLQTVMQLTVSPENRGKVSGIMNTFIGGLMPVAMMLSGFLARLIGTHLTIKLAFIAALLTAVPALFGRTFHAFLNYEPPAAEPTDETDDAVPVTAGETSLSAGE